MSDRPELPESWPDQSLSDPVIGRGALSRLVTPAQRLHGGLAVLWCDERGRMLQGAFVDQARPDAPGPLRRSVLSWVTSVCRDRPEGQRPLSLVLGMVRDRGPLTDDDRAWHQAALATCRGQGVRLLGTHLVTGDGAQTLPVGDCAA